MPTDDFLVGELREYRAQQLSKKLLEDADIQVATKTAEAGR